MLISIFPKVLSCKLIKYPKFIRTKIFLLNLKVSFQQYQLKISTSSHKMQAFGLRKHPFYMQQSGINLLVIKETMHVLTNLREIQTYIKQRLQKKSHPNQQTSQIAQIQSPSVAILPFDQLTVQSQNQLHKTQTSEIHELNQNLEQQLQKLEKLISDINEQYIKYHNTFICLSYLFIKFKFRDVNGKFMVHKENWNEMQDKKVYLNIDKNLYLKIYYLGDFTKKVIKYFVEIQESYPLQQIHLECPQKELQYVNQQQSKLKSQIQVDYSARAVIDNSRALKQLRNLVNITSVKPLNRPFLLGFWLATVVLMLSTIFFLIIYFDINFDTNNDFEDTFPIWRGLWHFILLIWLLGFNTSVFNYFKINFGLLTAFNNFHIPNPTSLLIVAAAFTSIHLFLFLIYLIHLAQIGNIKWKVIPQQFLPGVSWLIFLLFFLTPVRVFHFRSRLYPLMMFGRTLASPCLGTEFKFHWFTQVFVSFRQPIRDMLYTFTYYFIDNTVIYWNTIIFQTIAGISLYWMRIIQNCRQMYQNRLLGGMPYYGSIKCLLNSVTMITSYLSRRQQSEDLLFLGIWLVTAILSTSYAYHFDLKYDWGLLDKDHGYLRQRLIYRNKKIYYGIIVLNLILRCAWMLNVSPDVIRRLPIKPYLIVLLLTSLQVTRRSIWMIFRVEKQHIVVEQQLDSLFKMQTTSEVELKQVEMIEVKREIDLKVPNWMKQQNRYSIDTSQLELQSKLKQENSTYAQKLKLKVEQAQNYIKLKHISASESDELLQD